MGFRIKKGQAMHDEARKPKFIYWLMLEGRGQKKETPGDSDPELSENASNKKGAFEAADSPGSHGGLAHT